MSTRPAELCIEIELPAIVSYILLYDVCFTMFASRCLLYNFCFSMLASQCLLHNACFTMFASQCLLHNVCFIMFASRCFALQCFLHNACFTVLASQCLLHKCFTPIEEMYLVIHCDLLFNLVNLISRNQPTVLIWILLKRSSSLIVRNQVITWR